MNRTLMITLSIIGLVVLAAGGWFYMNWSKYAPDVYITETQNGTSTEVSTVDTTTDTTTPGSPTYTAGDIATHNSASSCYTIINGAVYDLTMWVAMHPGGKQAILSLCGIDGTARFSAKHGTDAKPNGALARFKIGLIAQ